jgi:ATP-dependent Clp protease, protease subunit
MSDKETNDGGFDRELYLFGNVGNDSMKGLVEQIIKINIHDDKQQKKLKEYKRKPITLFISSGGGSVYAGLSLISVIESSVTQVITRCDGFAMSMGFMIFISGHERVMSKHATLMFHDISTFQHGKLEELKEDIEQLKRLMEHMKTIVLDKTSILKEQLEGHLEKKSDWYIMSREAKKLKICDKVI